MPNALHSPPGFPDLRRHATGNVRPREGAGGAGRLLARLVAGGLDPDALPAAAALVIALEREVTVRAELDRLADSVSGTGRNTGCACNDPGREFPSNGATNRVAQRDTQELSMPATATASKAVRPKDPEAAALAAAAQKLARAAGLKSAYTSGEGRGVIDRLTVEKARGMLTISKDGGKPVRVKVATLRALLAGDRTDDIRAAAKVMADLARDLPGTLYGKKMSAFLLARSA